jgi:hypothetical protein
MAIPTLDARKIMVQMAIYRMGATEISVQMAI